MERLSKLVKKQTTFGKLSRIIVLALTLITLALTIFELFYIGKIYPGVKVVGTDLGGIRAQIAVDTLSKIGPQGVTLVINDKETPIETSILGIYYNPENTLISALSLGRTNSFSTNLKQKISALAGKVNLPLALDIDEVKFNAWLNSVYNETLVSEVESTIEIARPQRLSTALAGEENKKVYVINGKDGQEIDKQYLKNQTTEALRFAKGTKITPQTKTIKAKLSEEEILKLEKRAESLIGKTLKIEFENETFLFSTKSLLPLLKTQRVNEQKADKLVLDISNAINRQPQNARFEFKNGKVSQFAPGLDGIEVEKEEFALEITDSIETLITSPEKQIALSPPIERTAPEIATQEVNNLGISESIGRGTSEFRGSAKERVHNISLAASRLNGVLVKQGETFSFNQALGDISVFTGYQQAYVIKDGKTVLGDGGGVCQVSTTFFRAALDAGLPIVKRYPHSYRVAYYEQDSKPGFDATVYYPSVDLKIKNDTQNHILITSSVDIKKSRLIFELYGTGDSRKVEISQSKVWDIVPAPAPLYQDDPILPLGTQKQIDFEASGAKVSFNYKVTRGDEILQNRAFNSQYQPWQAVYLRGIAQ